MEKVFSTERLEKILPLVKSFIKEEILPLEAGHYQRSAEETYRILDEKREKVRKLGLWGLHVPKDEGGMGLTLCEFGQISEALARAPFYGHYTFNCQAPDIGNMELLSRFGTKAQKEAFLHPMLEGRIRSCFAMTEPEFAGSNPTRLATTAVKDGGH